MVHAAVVEEEPHYFLAPVTEFINLNKPLKLTHALENSLGSHEHFIAIWRHPTHGAISGWAYRNKQHKLVAQFVHDDVAYSSEDPEVQSAGGFYTVSRAFNFANYPTLLSGKDKRELMSVNNYVPAMIKHVNFDGLTGDALGKFSLTHKKAIIAYNGKVLELFEKDLSTEHAKFANLFLSVK